MPWKTCRVGETIVTIIGKHFKPGLFVDMLQMLGLLYDTIAL